MATTTQTATSLSLNGENKPKPQAAQNDSDGHLADSGHVAIENTEVLETHMSPPTFSSVEEHRRYLLEQMAGAFRIFARKGYALGAAGHISVRDPGNPDHFWLNPLGQHFGTLKASDMVLVDHEGNVIGGSRKPVNKAGFQIHGAVHLARPDVIAACHTHSIYGKAYSQFGKPIEMLNQDACTFYGDQAVYTDFGGVVLSLEEGKSIAEALGPHRNLILQNHGLLTAGQSVGEAAFLFILYEHACEAQLLADSSNAEKKYIPDHIAEFTHKAVAYPEGMWAEFQTELEYEEYLDGSFRK